MKRSTLIKDLVKIYEARPENCSSYHIVDMLIGAAEERGMLPPSCEKNIFYLEGGEMYVVYEWEPENENEM